MIPREATLVALAPLLLLQLVPIEAQDSRSYDTNDWIPITPQNLPENSRESKELPDTNQKQQPTSRVLNLDPPPQNYYQADSNHEHRNRKPEVRQYLQEIPYAKPPPNQRKQHIRLKPKPEYKYELPAPVHKQRAPANYYSNKDIIPQYQQPAPSQHQRYINEPPPRHQQYILESQQRPTKAARYPDPPKAQQQAPAPDAPSIYEKYNIPFNTSFYQSINPTTINREILGAIESNQSPALPPVPSLSLPPRTASQPNAVKDENPTVQLLYVPLESLQQNYQGAKHVYKQPDVAGSAQVYTPAPPQSKQHRLEEIEQDYLYHALQAQNLQSQIQQGEPVLIQTTSTTTTTTPKPTKKKPHQPPLAIFMATRDDSDVTKVLDTLREASTIRVQDSFYPGTPDLFIGPMSLKPADGYTKYPLPYLNSVDGNRIERKIDSLPFFVAPLSYKAPDGYSKIPLPSPHVGSVIVSNKEEVREKIPQQYKSTILQPNQISDYQTNQYSKNQNSFLNNARSSTAKPYTNTYSQDSTQRGGFQNNLISTTERPYNNPYLPESNAPVPQKSIGHIEPPRYSYQIPEKSSYAKTTPQPATLKYQESPIDQPQRFTQEDAFIPKDYYQDLNAQTYNVPETNSKLPAEFTAQDYYTPQKPQPSEETRRPIINATPKTLSREEINTLLEGTTKHSASTESLGTKKSQNIDINPLELAINEFELHQINSQLEPNKRKVIKEHHGSSDYKPPTESIRYSSAASPSYTTERPERSKPRRRKPSRRPTVETTEKPQEEDSQYTVLEQFSTKQRTTENYKQYQNNDNYRVPTTPAYDSRIDEVPTNAYRQTYSEESNLGGTSGSVQRLSSTPQYEEQKTIVENIPANVYNLGADQIQPIYSRPRTEQHNLNQETLLQGQFETTKSAYNTAPHRFNLESTSQPVTLAQTYQKEEVVDNSGYTTQSYVTPNQAVNNDYGQIYSQNPEHYSEPSYQRNNIDNSAPGSDYDGQSFLEDSAVRSLLVPQLLAPHSQRSGGEYHNHRSSTENVNEVTFTTTTTTETPTIQSTTTRARPRGRQRGQSRFAASSTTTTSAPRRASHRRRLPSRAQTERSSSTENASTETIETPRRSSTIQRFRTRGRPQQNQVAEQRISTTEHVAPSVDYSKLQTHAEEPKSFMQFENVVENQKIIRTQPESETPTHQKEYHQLYSFPTSAENQRLQYDNTAPGKSQVVDVEILHPVYDAERIATLTTGRDYSEPYTSVEITTQHSQDILKYKANVQSGGVIYNNEPAEDERTTSRSKGRVRGRPRLAASTTTASRNTPTRTEAPRQQEYFEYTKSNYEPSEIPSQRTQSYTRQEPLTIIENVNTESAPVQFVGHIKPKYYSSTVNDNKAHSTTVEIEKQTPKPRTRSRVRLPTRHNTQRTTDSEGQNTRNVEQATRRIGTSTSTRARGSSHYRPPVNLRKKSKEEDLDGQNYPESFLQKRHSTTARPTSFYSDDNEDQSPHASINRPSVVLGPNMIKDEEKGIGFKEEISENYTDEPLALPITGETESTMSQYTEQNEDTDVPLIENQTEDSVSRTNPTRKRRRKGVWKLVRQKPADPFETAESQNYQSVLNAFDTIGKVRPNNDEESSTRTIPHSKDYNYFNPAIEQNSYFDYESKKIKETTTALPITTTVQTDGTTASNEENSVADIATSTTTTVKSILKSFYEMFDSLRDTSENQVTTTQKVEKQEESTVHSSPVFPEEITEAPATTQSLELQNKNTENNVELKNSETTTVKAVDESDQQTTTVQAVSNLTSNNGIEPWEMKQVKTSTSTEISHETEICYKGRCIKSRDREFRG